MSVTTTDRLQRDIRWLVLALLGFVVTAVGFAVAMMGGLSGL